MSRARHIEVPRTARYHVLEPAGEGAGDTWFVLHGYRQLARRFLRRFEALAADDRRIVAPEGLSRFYLDRTRGRHGPEHRVGASWMTREDREPEIRDYVRYLDLLADRVLGPDPVRAPRVLGFSQGVHTAARWAVLGEREIAQLVLWGAYLPPDLEREAASRRLDALDLVLVEGEDDPHADPERRRRQDERLEAWGVVPRRFEHPGGHELDADLLASLLESPPAPAQNSPTNEISGTSS